jgi:hypothetical protein
VTIAADESPKRIQIAAIPSHPFSIGERMKCPVCPSTDLLMTERLSIEIDYCPQCRGVWLDRGELDKIIERSMHEPAQAATLPHYQAPRHGHYDKHHDGHYGYHRKHSFWKELFD